jgi:hypothetical protein
VKSVSIIFWSLFNIGAIFMIYLSIYNVSAGRAVFEVIALFFCPLIDTNNRIGRDAPAMESCGRHGTDMAWHNYCSETDWLVVHWIGVQNRSTTNDDGGNLVRFSIHAFSIWVSP